MILTDYLNLIPQENKQAEKFIGTVSVGVKPCVQIQDVMNSLITEYDIDYAAGVQLDVIGEWIGRGRSIPLPLDFYFTWDATAILGWNQGLWKGVFDPDTGVIRLPDDLYRAVLKAKIVSNNWDGNLNTIYEILVLGTMADISAFTVVDNHDMTMNIDTVGLTELQQALINQEILILKPLGVLLIINHV
jgi:hypothetical protein